MDCHCFLDSYINVIVNGSLFKVFMDREDPTGNLEDGCPSEEKRKLFSIHSGRGDDDFDIPSFLGYVFEDTKEHISVQTSFVGLVHNDRRVHLELIIVETLPEQDSVGHVFDDCLVGGAVFEPN